MTARFIIGPSLAVLRTLQTASVDLVLTSSPFLALRAYLPPEHPDKEHEVGSEATPGAFIDALLDHIEECDRVLAPHGSLVWELGDTYAGSGGAGGDYAEGGLRDGQERFDGSKSRDYGTGSAPRPPRRDRPAVRDWAKNDANPASRKDRDGWPLDKSLCLVPELLRFALAYGFNPLTGRQTPRWRVRNVVRWCLDGDTVVYAKTPKGIGPARLLHLAQNWQPDQWSLWDGTRWTKVLGWSSSTADDAIEIEFRNGERVSATREHEWPTGRGLLRTDALTVGDVVDSARLPDSDVPSPAYLPDADIGWLLGTFLADGSFDSRDRIQISGHRDESALRLARLSALAAAYDGTCTSHEVGEGNEGVVVLRSYVLAAVIRRYVGGDGARTKCLRAAAWRRNNAFLAHMLAGYLDGDGWYDAKNARWRLGFTDNPWLARDLRTICARLGYSCRVRRLPRAADPRGGQFAGTASHYHRGDIRLAPGPLVKPDSEIVALRPSKRRRFYDIGVEGEPHLFALASGILTHNCRPNPPVGALADKVRPATSELLVACKGRSRYFDLDAIRTPASGYERGSNAARTPAPGQPPKKCLNTTNPAGAPPLDHWWHDDVFDQDAWDIPTAPYKGAHYATWPPALLTKPILAMCPQRVCTTCGRPSERIVEISRVAPKDDSTRHKDAGRLSGHDHPPEVGWKMSHTTTDWTDCGHDTWRHGVVLDPFAGTGTTLAVATGHGRDAIGIDLDSRNADLVRDRVGLFLDVIEYLSIEMTVT